MKALSKDGCSRKNNSDDGPLRSLNGRYSVGELNHMYLRTPRGNEDIVYWCFVNKNEIRIARFKRIRLA